MASGFEPRILCFICNSHWHLCTDLKGGFRAPFGTDIRIVKVACSHRLEPEIVLEPFLASFDGVLILECHSGACPYAAARDYDNDSFREVATVLDAADLESRRLHLDIIPPEKEKQLNKIARNMIERIKLLGPLRPDKITRAKLRMAQDKLEARRVRELVAAGLVQVNGRKTRKGKVCSSAGDLHDEYIKDWLSLLIEEHPISLKRLSEIMDIAEEHITRYLLAIEKERHTIIPPGIRQGVMAWRSK